jgi:hypothetical protein
MRLLSVLIFSFALVACASQSPRQQQRGDIYLRHAAQEETTSVLYSSVRSWRRAGDGAVLIEFNRNRHYLFQLEPRCSLEIPFARSIALLSTSSQRVDRFDRVRVGSETCRIVSIREVDFEAVQADLAALRQAPEPALETIETDVIHADDYSGGT